MFGVLGFRVLGFRESRVQDAKGFRESRVSGFQGLGVLCKGRSQNCCSRCGFEDGPKADALLNSRI